MTVLKPEWCLTAEGLRTGLAIELAGDRIAAVVEAERHPDVPVARGRLALPGLVNAHSHAFQRAIRGHVQWRPSGRDDFWSWRDRMYRTANALDPDGVEAVSALAFLEMAEAGITQVGEFHYLHHQPDGTPYADPDELAKRVIAAALRVGIRICLLRVAYLRGGADQPLRPDQRRFGDRGADDVLAAVDRLGSTFGPGGSGADPRVTIGLAPHSVRAVDRASLAELASFRGPVHAHVSEQPAENASCMAEHDCSPLTLFDDVGLVGERFVAVHLTWPMEGDVDRLVARDGAVCVCPSTELDLGDGWLPVDVRRRARMCIGTDSHAVIDPLGEARTLELHARAMEGRRNVLSPEGEFDGLSRKLLHAASTQGDRALGGSGAGIATGAPADLAILDLRRVAAEGVPPLQAAAFVAGSGWTDDVWVAGRRIVAGGRHPDAERILAAARPHLV